MQAATVTISPRSSDRTSTPDRTLSASGTDDALFEDLLTTVQSLAGVRIEARVESLIPDGRGLEKPERTAWDERIDVLRRDAERTDADRRELLQARAAQSGQRRSDRHTNRTEVDRATDSAPRGSRPPSSPHDSAVPLAYRVPQSTGGRPAQADRSPVATKQPPDDTTEPVRLASSHSGNKPTGTSAPPGGGTTGRGTAEAANVSSSTATSHVGAAQAPAHTVSVARQIGEALGARVTENAGRTVSATGSTLGSDGASGKRTADAASHGSRSGRTPDRPPGAEHDRPARRAAFDRLVRAVRMNVGLRRSTARLHLNPPELGRVRIDVRMIDQQLQLTIRTQTQDARQILSSRLEGLREALSVHGVTMERVELPPPETDGQPYPAAGQEQPHAEGRHAHQFGADESADWGRETAGDDPRDEQDTPPGGDSADRGGAAAETRLDIRA